MTSCGQWCDVIMSLWCHRRELSFQDLILTLVAMGSCYGPIFKTAWWILLIFYRQIDMAGQRSHAEIHCHQANSWAVRECLLISMATDWYFQITFSRGHPLAPVDCSCAIWCRSVKNSWRRSRTNKQPNKRTENSNYSMMIDIFIGKWHTLVCLKLHLKLLTSGSMLILICHCQLYDKFKILKCSAWPLSQILIRSVRYIIYVHSLFNMNLYPKVRRSRRK